MDPMQLLAIVAVVLAVVLVGLTLVVVSMVRNQQQAQKQAARRAVEAEKQERSRLQSLVAKVDPLARKAEGDEIIAAARAEAERVRADAERARQESDTSSRLERERVEMLLQEVERRERRVGDREDQHAGLQRKLDERLGDLELTLAELDARRAALDEAEAGQRKEIARIAGMTPQAAKAELLAQVEHEARLDAVHLSRTIEAEARRDGDERARQIIVGAIQRLATDQTTESVVTTVPLPGDEMKGRIIGREGRNIRAFEQTTGVNVMIDDTPESVLLSSFDPVRREVARLTLTELVADGRIHPARIEEVYERSKRRIDEICLRAAEDAVAEVGLTDLDPGLLPTIGALQYRTSYGQNVLKHLVECAHLAGLMASELNLDPASARRAAFLHDIGKALTHEVEGSHAKVGADLARRFGEHPDIVNAIEAHHNEVEPQTVIAVLTQAADAISGGRPGARRESLEVYVKRLQRLEEIARAHKGVDKVFAMQAGREIRVMVQPDCVDDAATQVMAKEIAKQVETELTYPGSIKVTVVRESRVTETAH